MFTRIEKPIPTLPPVRERIALLMPTPPPSWFTSGPPALPGLIAASVCRKSSKGPWPIERPLALMMPAVTVFCRPNGEPTGGTHAPPLTTQGRPERGADGEHPAAHLDPVGVAEHGRRVGAAALQLQHREVGLAVHAHQLGFVLLAVRGGHLDLGGALDHVRGGEHDD